MRRAVLFLFLFAACGAPARPAAKAEEPISSCDAPPAASAKPTRHEVSGRVLDPHGAPVAGASVGASPDMRPPAAPSPPVITDANGAFRWAVWTIADFRYASERVELAVRAPSGDEARFETDLAKPAPITVVVHGTRELAGRITAGGAPLADAQVQIGCERIIAAAGHECADAVLVDTDATGAFHARVASPAIHSIFVRADLASLHSPLIQVLDRDRADIAIDLPPITPTSLRLLDDLGHPLEGVAVSPDCTGSVMHLATGADGHIAIRVRAEDLAPNAVFDLCFRKPGYLAREIIRRPADDTVVLARSATVCGRVSPSTPAGGRMTVIATTAPPGTKHFIQVCRGCETDSVMLELPAAGPFRLEVPAGSYRLWADVAGLGGTPSRRVEARPSATVDVGTLEIDRTTASISGIVLDPDGKPAHLKEIVLQRVVTGTEGNINEDSRTLSVGADGRFAATELPEGTYYVGYGNQSDLITITRAGPPIQLDYDPSRPRGCEGCDPEPFDPATYDGAWIPAFSRSDDVIDGPTHDDRALPGPHAELPLPPGILPGDVIEESDGKPGSAGLPGRHNTPVSLRLHRPGTGEHLTITVKRTVPAER